MSKAPLAKKNNRKDFAAVLCALKIRHILPENRERSSDMLRNIPKILPPELVKTMMEMGHSDVLIIADANFPGTAHA